MRVTALDRLLYQGRCDSFRVATTQNPLCFKPSRRPPNNARAPGGSGALYSTLVQVFIHTRTALVLVRGSFVPTIKAYSYEYY